MVVRAHGHDPKEKESGARLRARQKETKKAKEKKKKKKRKKGKRGRSSSSEVDKRKIVRGKKPKYCVLCMCHSSDVDPLQDWDEDCYGAPPFQPMAWGHPREGDGVEGSECYYCRRLHRAKAPLSALFFVALVMARCN